MWFSVGSDPEIPILLELFSFYFNISKANII